MNNIFVLLPYTMIKTHSVWQYYFLVIGIFLLLIAKIFGEGMFMDGIIYANISKNLATNICSVWHLKLTEVLQSNFHEHPPLAMFLQSVLMRVFGTSVYVEKWYSLSTFVISGFLIL